MSGKLVFYTPDATGPQRRAMAERAMARFPGEFASVDDAVEFLTGIITPASERWAYIGNAKTGTSSTKRFLFHLEFGVPLTVNFQPLVDINPDAISHVLARAGVFRNVTNLPTGLKVMNKALRLTTARHPVARALSSFNYICLADIASSPWLVGERLRMNATSGFDWSKDRHSHDGFVKFLTYLSQDARLSDQAGGDPHLRPQVRNVRPKISEPDLVGRTEDLPAFFRAIADRLDMPMPSLQADQASNRQPQANPPDTLLSKQSKDLIAQVFAADFDWLNEDVDNWRP